MARIAIDLSSGKIKETNVVVGIDLGTTNSLIAKIEDGMPVAIADVGKTTIVPSIVHIDAIGNITVGEEAKNYLLIQPNRTIYSVKRLLGKSYSDLENHAQSLSYQIAKPEGNNGNEEEGMLQIVVGNRTFTPIEISSLILKELKSRAEHKLKVSIDRAVITVPAYFNDSQRQATRDAGKFAGLDVLRIINEPTAAALAYGLGINPNESQKVAIFDLGGGTFDVTILQIEGNVFDVISTNGNSFLGGDDIDANIVQYWINLHNLQNLNSTELQFLRIQAEKAKISINASNDDYIFSTVFSQNSNSYKLELNTEILIQLAKPIIDQTLDCCRKALDDAHYQIQDIEYVVLVGGSTRLNYLKECVENFFQKKPLDHLNPDEVVALGAAVMGDILAGNRDDLLLLDVTPLSLGIETLGGLMDVLIHRNTKIPHRVSRGYTTSLDGQVNLRISVFQGEREEVKHNRKLAEFILKGIPPMPAGLPKVEITFGLDADGVLKVTAQETRSGVKQIVDIKPQYGLTDAEVEKMLIDSLTNAKDDVDNRLLIEAREEARQLIFFTQRFLANHFNLVLEVQKNEIEKLIAQLEAAINSTSKADIRTGIEALEIYTRPYAELVMDEAVKRALVGQDV